MTDSPSATGGPAAIRLQWPHPVAAAAPRAGRCRSQRPRALRCIPRVPTTSVRRLPSINTCLSWIQLGPRNRVRIGCGTYDRVILGPQSHRGFPLPRRL
jgi:hypothetical protein